MSVALRHRRWLRRAAVALLSLLVVLGALLWWLGTDSALQFAARRLDAATGGALVVEGAQGSLYGPLRVARLVYHRDGRKVVAEGVALDWSPWALWRGRLAVDSLTSKRLRVDWPASGKSSPPALPTDLRLPLRPTIDVLRIDSAELKFGGKPISLHAVQLRLTQEGGAYRLALQRLDSSWGHGIGNASLAARPPFALKAHVDLQQDSGTLTYRLRADADGSLADLRVAAEAVAGQAKARLQGELKPFTATPVRRADMSLQRVDPSRFKAGLPAAMFSAEVQLQTAADGGLTGGFRLTNADPGPVNQKRWPLRQATGTVAIHEGDIVLSDLALQAAGEGRADGTAAWRAGQLQLQLTVRGLDLAGVVSTLRATSLDGKVNLEGDLSAQRMEASLRQDGYALNLKARHEPGQVDVDEATVQRGKARVQFSGHLTLKDARPFQVQAVLRDFDPAAFGDYPAARLSADIDASGSLAPRPVVRLHYVVAPGSTYRQAALGGEGRLQWRSGRVSDAQVGLSLGGTRLAAHGAFGATDDHLQWSLESPDLGVLGPDFGGQLKVSGVVSGSMTAPSGNLMLEAARLRWAGRLALARLRGHASLAPGAGGAVVVSLAADDVNGQGWRAASVVADARGTRARHTLDVRLRNEQGELSASASGGYANGTWSGELTTLDTKGALAVQLRAPAPLRVARNRIAVSHAMLDVDGGTVDLRQLSLQSGRVISAGRLSKLPLRGLRKLPGWPQTLSTDLVVSGQWSVHAADALDAAVTLQRDGGDIAVNTEPATALGLDRLALSVDVKADRVHARLDAHGSTSGAVTIDGSSRLTQRGGRWGFAGDAPLAADVHLDMPSLAWLSELFGAAATVTFKGRAGADLQARGTVGAPELSGAVHADTLGLAMPEQGIELTDGTLRAELHGQRLVLNQLLFHGGDGQLRGAGSVSWGRDAPDAHLTLTAEHLRLLSRPDRLLVVSGQGEARLSGRQLHIQGKVQADRGNIELPRAGTPALDSDVVVLDGQEQIQARRHLVDTVLDLELALGDHFTVRGRGLDAQLGGGLHVRTGGGRPPQGSGNIQVTKGTYAAYGQRLDIERGILNFQGPLDNPALNIVAMRRNLTVEAGVAITGTAQDPQVQLVSNPSVPDSEKLSWLVLGHGLDNASGQDYSVLQTAAGALLASGESAGLQARLAQAAGLDELSLRGDGTLQSTVVTLGKRLSSRAFLSYEHGLTGADSLVKITYTLTRRLSVQAETGTDNAMDLFYTFSFD